MTVLRGTFPILKSVCQRCMEETTIPWYEEDEARWKRGLVQCPQNARALKPEMKWCLKRAEVKAIKEGSIVIWDEMEM